jgi:hypothetical protein
MLKPEDPKTIQVNGRAKWNSLSGVGFQLTPAPGNVGKLPLLVELDGEASRRAVVDSPTMQRGGHNFSTLEIIGAIPGDVYTLTIAPTHADVKEPGYFTDRAGNLRTRGIGGDVLAEVHFTSGGNHVSEADAYQDVLYLTQGNPSQFVRLPPTLVEGVPGADLRPIMWDLRDWRGFRLTWLANGLAYSGEASVVPSLKFFMELFPSGSGVHAKPTHYLAMGGGSLESNQWAGNHDEAEEVMGVIEVGASVEALLLQETHITHRSMFASIYLTKAAGWNLRNIYAGNGLPDDGDPFNGTLVLEGLL